MQRKSWLIACFLICTNCLGQQYPFVHYTPKDGLVNSRVRNACQDSKGRMYFMTFGGLSVYDGARFRNYTMQNGLLTDLVNDVLEVGDDSLLVAVNTSGLNVLVHGQMKQSEIAENDCPIVNRFLKSNDGNIYTTTDAGLYKIKRNRLEKLPAIIPGQKDSAIYLGAIAEYKDFLVFTSNDLRSNRGLYLYNKKNFTISDFIPDLLLYSLKTDRSGILWLSTDKEVAILDTLALAGGKLEIRKPYTTYSSPVSLETGAINFNRQNELLVAVSGKGIIYYRKNGTLMHISFPDLSAVVTQCLFIDRENVLWVCHDGNGVYKLANTNLRSFTSFDSKNKSGISLISAVTDDSCWMVMNDRQWILNTRSTSKSFSIIPSFDVLAVYHNKNILYAASANKLYVADRPANDETTIRFKNILTLPDTSAFQPTNVTDPYGNLILAETYNISVIQSEKLLFTYPVKPNDLIEGMYVDKKNQLWVISRFDGLNVFSIHPGERGNYLKKEYQFITEFGSASPRCMVVDQNEILWVGTRYHGLMGFEYKNNQLRKLQHFQAHNGLTDNFITSLACDGDNNIIIGTQTGLDRLIRTREGYRPENITKSNNIFSYVNYVWTDAGNNAFARTNTGTVFRVEPVQPVKDMTEPQLLIEELKVNGKLFSSPARPLKLRHYQRNISFSVAAPTFIDERQVKYSYLLTGGGNDEWSDLSSIADFSLLNLSPGNYMLRVKAIFYSTAYPAKEIEFSFSILPPWWKTWWFRTIAGLLIIGLLIIGIRFYLRRKLEKERTVLEKQQAVEKERTRIATDMHDDLGAGLSKIRFLSETVQRNISDETHQPILQNIANSSVELVDKFNEIIWAMNEKNNSLEDLLYYIRNYTAKYCEENGLGYKINIPENIPARMISGEMRRHIFLTVKESLHNVVKHAEAKNVWLDVLLDAFITITVQDDGKGFDPVEMRNAGNGLRNMEQRVNSLNGKLLIENENGTLLKIMVPFPLV